MIRLVDKDFKISKDFEFEFIDVSLENLDLLKEIFTIKDGEIVRLSFKNLKILKKDD